MNALLERRREMMVKLEEEVDPYVLQPFTVVAQRSGNCYLALLDLGELTSLKYKKNDGPWIVCDFNGDYYTGMNDDWYNLNAGDRISLIGEGPTAQGLNLDHQYCGYEGNLLSLIFGDTYLEQTTLPERAFYGGFRSNSTVTDVLSLANLRIPVKSVGTYALYQTFRNYVALSTVYKKLLPATTVGDYAYLGMFENCQSLENAPDLPAKVLGQHCYQTMFNNCYRLKTAPKLPATTLSEYCYAGMFTACRYLVNPPALPVTELKPCCYRMMFRNCISLTTAPQLPATTLADSCYQQMFYGCTSLRTAPALPATTLTYGCYNAMFRNCTSLTTAPELPATEFPYDEEDGTINRSMCYTHMFNGCTKLNYVKAMILEVGASIEASSPTYRWLYKVSSTGTFVKNSAATWTDVGSHAVPRGWTIQTASS